jgi:predicted metalloprotease with PDZ domain
MDAGLLPSDVIVGVNGSKVASSQELYKCLNTDQKAVMNIKRNVPLEVDWDGRVMRFETVERAIVVTPSELNVFVRNPNPIATV